MTMAGLGALGLLLAAPSKKSVDSLFVSTFPVRKSVIDEHHAVAREAGELLSKSAEEGAAVRVL